MIAPEEIVNAIRSDESVGRGSCSSFDEAYTDSELVEYFTQRKCQTTEDVLNLAYNVESVQFERLRESYR